MPELPEVETIARELARRLAGVTFGELRAAREDYVVAAPPDAAAHLVGRRVLGVQRSGKRLTVRMEGSIMLVHLGMSGRITVAPEGEPVPTHTHFRLALEGRGLELRIRDPRRFGGVWISAAGESAGTASGGARNGARPGPLGPDALTVPLAEFRRLLSRRRRIKALLLDQHALAGLGNIYVDEILWASGVHPLARASGLRGPKVAEMHRHLRRILAAAIRDGGSTFRDYRSAEGREGRYRARHRVWGREGLPCPRCGRRIERLLAAGRSSHVCPRCQRRPRNRPRRAARGPQRGGPSSSIRRKAASSRTGMPRSSAFFRFDPASAPATT